LHRLAEKKIAHYSPAVP